MNKMFFFIWFLFFHQAMISNCHGFSYDINFKNKNIPPDLNDVYIQEKLLHRECIQKGSSLVHLYEKLSPSKKFGQIGYGLIWTDSTYLRVAVMAKKTDNPLKEEERKACSFNGQCCAVVGLKRTLARAGTIRSVIGSSKCSSAPSTNLPSLSPTWSRRYSRCPDNMVFEIQKIFNP